MTTTRKHIAVYLSPNNEADLKRYCRENNLKNSTAINDILSQFFNVPQESNLSEPIVSEELADLVAQQLEEPLEKSIVARVESRLGELINLQLNGNLPTALTQSQQIKSIIERLGNLENLVNKAATVVPESEEEKPSKNIEQKPSNSSAATPKRGRKPKPTTKRKPTEGEIINAIKRLNHELNLDNYLPIFYLRREYRNSLNRKEFDKILYQLESSHQITLSTLEEGWSYPQDQIDDGIPQDDDSLLFFILLNS